MSGLPFERFWRRLDPRRSVTARLLLGFSLAFLLPGGLFLLLIQRRLSAVGASSSEQVAAVRVAEAGVRLAQDASFRAEWIDGRARTVEEAARALAVAARVILGSPAIPAAPAATAFAVDGRGNFWTPSPDGESVVLVPSAGSAPQTEALRDAARTAPLAAVMADLLHRRSSIRSVRVWTASGMVRHSPWFDTAAARRESSAKLERFRLDRAVAFPEAPPAAGDDAAVWTGTFVSPPETAAARLVHLLVPVRDASGRLAGGVALEIDARRYVTEAMESWAPAGDFWFALDGEGHALLMTPRAAASLGWNGVGGARLADAGAPELKRLAQRALHVPQFSDQFVLDGRRAHIATARVGSTQWVFGEGLSEQALETIRGEAARALPAATYAGLRRDVILLFVVLLPAVLVVTAIVSRRVSAPVSELLRAAEDIGRGRPVEVSGKDKEDELGRLASAIDTMGRRVERRVETLRRLHDFSRSAYRMTDPQEVLARATQAVAGFTGAERVWFGFYDSHTNRLEARLPAWNVTEEMAGRLQVSLDARSIEGMVFRTGEPYCANDLARDPYANRDLLRASGALNGVFAPLKTEEETLGVAVAVNREAGFFQEEVDALTSFADLASLLLRNARLYSALSGTVDELRHASRLKDHFLQNVNHELRTPLTAIVGWTDLFADGDVNEETMRRGLRQIRQSSRVLLALIDDLLDLARLDRGAMTLQWRPVLLSEVIHRSIETVRLMAESRGVVMILAPLPEPMAPVRADALRLQQILWNLLSNAIHFTPEHGRVVVRVEREAERYLISVEDDGIGIPESELPHVFERFRQVDGSATRGHAGMGIGLALARMLVELHGGAIWASSVVGQGSRFTFSLPVRGGEPPVASSRAPVADSKVET
ncbi:MAG TPA: ATP-binding protein [Thermoanaerobaculia bacterium]